MHICNRVTGNSQKPNFEFHCFYLLQNFLFLPPHAPVWYVQKTESWETINSWQTCTKSKLFDLSTIKFSFSRPSSQKLCKKYYFPYTRGHLLSMSHCLLWFSPQFPNWAIKLWNIIKCFWNFSDCYIHSMLRNSPAKLHTILLTLIILFLFHVFFRILIYFFFKKIFFFSKRKTQPKNIVNYPW